MKQYKILFLYTMLIFEFSFTIIAADDSGGELIPQQAAYDVNYYRLDLSIDPTNETISGSLLARVKVLDILDSLVLDLHDDYVIDSILLGKGESRLSSVQFHRLSGRIFIYIPDSTYAGDMISAKVFYHGTPPSVSGGWYSGFHWQYSASGQPWIGVTCEPEGADIWWPCKDHPSDEPDSMDLYFTVPQPLTCVSNGVFRGSTYNADSTNTFNWFIPSSINNYNVTLYAAEYSLIEDSYYSVSGDSIPFYFWVLPESYEAAVNHMPVFQKEFQFVESICGPYPFGKEKHGWAQVRYYGMEHQTVIAYGNNFQVNDRGYDYIHLHELAHEWWGNLVTAKSWSDVWIHEGLATYMEKLYVEHISGIDAYYSAMYRPPNNNHPYALAPREPFTATNAFHYLNPYRRGEWVMHTLRFHLGDEMFFKVLKHWAYPDTSDTDNKNGRLCRLVTTDDMKELAEQVTGVELDPFFEVFFREVKYPYLNIERSSEKAKFTWITESNVPLDLNVPIRVNGVDQIVELVAGEGSLAVSHDDVIIVDPDEWIIMSDPIITDVEDSNNGQLTEFALKQNYPNPFNPSTTIKYQIPSNVKGETLNVSLKIYDILGRVVATQVNEHQSSGNYEVQFNASELTSGTYFYQLTVGSFIQTKKMLLIK